MVHPVICFVGYVAQLTRAADSVATMTRSTKLLMVHHLYLYELTTNPATLSHTPSQFLQTSLLSHKRTPTTQHTYYNHKQAMSEFAPPTVSTYATLPQGVGTRAHHLTYNLTGPSSA